MKAFCITFAITFLSLILFGERRALRVLPAEAVAAVSLERVAMQQRRASITNITASVELINACTNWARVSDRRMAYEDYVVDRTGKETNTVVQVQAARLEILEVQRVK